MIAIVTSVGERQNYDGKLIKKVINFVHRMNPKHTSVVPTSIGRGRAKTISLPELSKPNPPLSEGKLVGKVKELAPSVSPTVPTETAVKKAPIPKSRGYREFKDVLEAQKILFEGQEVISKEIAKLTAALSSPDLFLSFVKDNWPPIDMSEITAPGIPAPASEVVVSEGFATFIRYLNGEPIQADGNCLVTAAGKLDPADAMCCVKMTCSAKPGVYCSGGNFYCHDTPPRLTVMLRLNSYLTKQGGFQSPYLLGMPQSHMKYGPHTIGLNLVVEEWASRQGWYAASALGPAGIKAIVERENEIAFWKKQASKGSNPGPSNVEAEPTVIPKKSSVPVYYTASQPVKQSHVVSKKVTKIVEDGSKKDTTIVEEVVTSKATGPITPSEAGFLISRATEAGISLRDVENNYIETQFKWLEKVSDKETALINYFKKGKK